MIPGNRAADIDPVFADLKSFLKGFVEEALEVQAERLAKAPKTDLAGNYPVESQRALGLAMMQAVGFDMNRGSLGVSHHPFCGGVPTDVRLTTRYRTDEFLSALMGILHETGHGLYEQNLPQETAHWPSARARGMAMHESQSLFVEKQIGRNPAFWAFALPKVEEHLGERLTLDELLPHLHHVERGLIRVDADEVTYPLHVILRYELEQDMLAGRLEVRDLPEAWDAKMRRLSRPFNAGQSEGRADAGRALAGRRLRLFPVLHARRHDGRAAVRRDQEAPSDVDDAIATGDFTAVNDWRRGNIWSVASMKSTPQIMQAATGEPLNAAHFIAHLKERYGRN